MAARQSLASYRPFGRTLTQPTNPALHIGFTGHDRTTADTSLNLVYMNARYYMPGTGRFLSADTLIPDPGNSQAFNRYSYVHNNPLRFTDPTGHCAMVISGRSQQRDPADAECWNQYDDLLKRLGEAGVDDPAGLVGSGADWAYRNDFEATGLSYGDAIVRLHRNYGFDFNYLLNNRWGAYVPYDDSMKQCAAAGAGCSVGYDRVNLGSSGRTRRTVCVYQDGVCSELYSGFRSASSIFDQHSVVGTWTHLKSFLDSVDKLIAAERIAAMALVAFAGVCFGTKNPAGCAVAASALWKAERDVQAAQDNSLSVFNYLWFNPTSGVLAKKECKFGIGCSR